MFPFAHAVQLVRRLTSRPPEPPTVRYSAGMGPTVVLETMLLPNDRFVIVISDVPDAVADDLRSSESLTTLRDDTGAAAVLVLSAPVCVYEREP
jgi:hypothetical protein